MTSYLDFLKLILTWGDKLPAALVIVRNIIDEFGQLASLFGVKQEITHNAPAITPDVLECEGQIADLLPAEHSASEHGKLGDGTLLRNAWAFFQAHPELWTLLLTFIK